MHHATRSLTASQYTLTKQTYRWVWCGIDLSIMFLSSRAARMSVGLREFVGESNYENLSKANMVVISQSLAAIVQTL